MWRTSVVVLVAGLLVAGCSGAPADDDPRPVVLTTFTVLADMTRQVAGDRVRVESLTRPGAEIHDYEPSPDDLVRGAGADLLIENGMGLERWFSRFVDRATVPAVVASEGIEPLPIAAGEYRDRPNPHAWMSPAAGVRYVTNIRDALTRLDPPGAASYAANAERYAAEIRAVGEQLSADLAGIPPDRRVLVTCEGAFSYLARDAGLREAYLWPVNAEGEGAPRQIAGVVGVVRDRAVPAVFCESTVNDSAQRQVAEETGAELAGPLHVDSLTGPDGVAPSYLDLLRHDAGAIAEGLAGARP